MQSDRSRARELHSALVDAMAGEHRLRRQALKEEQESARWAQRAQFADERGLLDLAAGARARAARHAHLAGLFAERADDLQAEVRLLRDVPGIARGAGRAPPTPSLEARFRELELNAELDRIHAARRPGPARTEAPAEA